MHCSIQAPASAAGVLNGAHVVQAGNLSSMHAPMFGLRGCLNFFGQGTVESVFFVQNFV